MGPSLSFIPLKLRWSTVRKVMIFLTLLYIRENVTYRLSYDLYTASNEFINIVLLFLLLSSGRKRLPPFLPRGRQKWLMEISVGFLAFIVYLILFHLLPFIHLLSKEFPPSPEGWLSLLREKYGPRTYQLLVEYNIGMAIGVLREEIFFRWFLMSTLIRWVRNKWMGLFLQVIFFTLAHPHAIISPYTLHLTWFDAADIAFGGCVLGILMLWRRSIIVPYLFHLLPQLSIYPGYVLR